VNGLVLLGFITHRIHGAAIYGNIYHQYTPNVSIYTSTMDPSWVMFYVDVAPKNLRFFSTATDPGSADRSHRSISRSPNMAGSTN
jgi:hypothetical protein